MGKAEIMEILNRAREVLDTSQDELDVLDPQSAHEIINWIEDQLKAED